MEITQKQRRHLLLGFETLRDMQAQTSTLDPFAVVPEDEVPSKQQIASYGLAWVDEIHEFLKELGWKPWKPQTGIDPHRVIDEFADILAFLGLFLNYLEFYGFDMGDVVAAYNRKNQINKKRLTGKVPGYDPRRGASVDQLLETGEAEF